MKHRGKVITFSTVALGGVVLVAGAITVKDPLLEKWNLRKLETGDEIERHAASEALAHVGSRVVPGILDAMRRVDHSGQPVTLETLKVIQFSRYRIFEETLGKIGKPAVPYLVRGLNDENRIFAYIVLHTLHGMYDDLLFRAWAERVAASPPLGLRIGGEVESPQAGDEASSLVPPPSASPASRWGPLPTDDPTTLLEILENEPSEPTVVREAAGEMLKKIKDP